MTASYDSSSGLSAAAPLSSVAGARGGDASGSAGALLDAFEASFLRHRDAPALRRASASGVTESRTARCARRRGASPRG